MTSTQYKNVIDYTLTQLPAETDSLTAVREILRNCGTPLPQGTPSDILNTLLSNEYLAWEECTYAEAIKQANLGVVAIGISGNNIMIIEPQTESAANSAAVISAATIASQTSTKYFIYGPFDTKASTNHPTIPKRISQYYDGNDPDWDIDLWGSTDNATSGCAAACISMALSCVGIEMTPKKIIEDQNSETPGFINDWGKPIKGYGTYQEANGLICVYNALKNYYRSPEMFTPPVVLVRPKTPQQSSHYAVVCGYSDKDHETYFSIDPGFNGYDYSEGKPRTDRWGIAQNSNPQVIQYQRIHRGSTCP